MARKVAQLHGEKYLVFEHAHQTSWRVFVRKDGNEQVYEEVFGTGQERAGTVDIFTLMPPEETESETPIVQVQIYTHRAGRNNYAGVELPRVKVVCNVPASIDVQHDKQRVVIDLMCDLDADPFEGSLLVTPDMSNDLVYVDPYDEYEGPDIGLGMGMGERSPDSAPDPVELIIRAALDEYGRMQFQSGETFGEWPELVRIGGRTWRRSYTTPREDLVVPHVATAYYRAVSPPEEATLHAMVTLEPDDIYALVLTALMCSGHIHMYPSDAVLPGWDASHRFLGHDFTLLGVESVASNQHHTGLRPGPEGEYSEWPEGGYQDALYIHNVHLDLD